MSKRAPLNRFPSTCSQLVLHVTGAQAVKCCLVLCEHMLSVGFSGIPLSCLHKLLVPVLPSPVQAENLISLRQG